MYTVCTALKDNQCWNFEEGDVQSKYQHLGIGKDRLGLQLHFSYGY